jgi:hypothetical protein
MLRNCIVSSFTKRNFNGVKEDLKPPMVVYFSRIGHESSFSNGHSLQRSLRHVALSRVRDHQRCYAYHF